MIIASAIKFHIEKTDKDVVLCGLRHGLIFEQMKLLGFAPKGGYKEIAQGFITDGNKFLDRKEAYTHAKMCGQLSSRVVNIHICAHDPELTSEDLW